MAVVVVEVLVNEGYDADDIVTATKTKTVKVMTYLSVPTRADGGDGDSGDVPGHAGDAAAAADGGSGHPQHRHHHHLCLRLHVLPGHPLQVGGREGGGAG